MLRMSKYLLAQSGMARFLQVDKTIISTRFNLYQDLDRTIPIKQFSNKKKDPVFVVTITLTIRFYSDNDRIIPCSCCFWFDLYLSKALYSSAYDTTMNRHKKLQRFICFNIICYKIVAFVIQQTKQLAEFSEYHRTKCFTEQVIPDAEDI